MEKYYALHERIIESLRNSRFQSVVDAVEETIPLYRELVRQTKAEYGKFDIEVSVAIEKGGKVVAAMGRQDILRIMERTLRDIQETKSWAENVAHLIEDSEIGDGIVQVVQQNPGIEQGKLKSRLAVDDGKRIANIAYWLEKVGRIRREKEGTKYRLFI